MEDIQHPHRDILGIAGREIGYAVDPKHKFKVCVFSHPAVHTVEAKDASESIEVIGETYRYSVELNFANVGRKVVTCVVRNVDVTTSEHKNSILKKKVLDFLENTSENLVAEHGIENRIPWDDQREDN
jgi:hypothetical protein